MLMQEILSNIIQELYPETSVTVARNQDKIIVKPESTRGCSISDLEGVLTYNFQGVKNPEKYLTKKGNWVSNGYLAWNPLPYVKNCEYAKKGVIMDDLKSVIVAPNALIDAPLNFNESILNPLRQVTIRKGTFVGEKSTINTTTYDKQTNTLTVGSVYVGRNCIVGGGAKLFPGTIINDNATVGVVEKFQGILPSNTKYSHLNYASNELHTDLTNEKKVLFNVAKETIKRLMNNAYKGKEVSLSLGKMRVYISPDNKGIHYSEKNLYNTIMDNNNILSCMYNGLGINVNKIFETNNPVKLLSNRINTGIGKLIQIESRLRNRFYENAGVIIGNNVTLGKDIFMEYLHPEFVHLGDNSIMQQDSFATGHFYTSNALMHGIVYINKDCVLGKGAITLPGTYLPEGFKVKPETSIQGIF